MLVVAQEYIATLFLLRCPGQNGIRVSLGPGLLYSKIDTLLWLVEIQNPNRLIKTCKTKYRNSVQVSQQLEFS